MSTDLQHDFLATVITGVITGLVVGITFNLFNWFRFKIGAWHELIIHLEGLIQELEDNKKGRGDQNYPFHFFWLHKISRKEFFWKKYPEAFQKSIICISQAHPIQGNTAANVQAIIIKLQQDCADILENLKSRSIIWKIFH